ncbi:YchJ family metal-binding protein [Thermithiobacillus plumbiphilus]|uniref:YchJ family metal-binding protein n=1 Tax=Thermithiobacillus plumbiphilus TaxID=1729899 RepID=A0ABU9D9G0_9PROT
MHDSPSALFLARFEAFRQDDTRFIWETHSRGSDFYKEYPEPEDFRAGYGAMLIRGVPVQEVLESQNPEAFARARALLPADDEPAEDRGLLVYALIYKTGQHKNVHHELGLFLLQEGHWGFHSSISTQTRRYRPGTALSPVIINGVRFQGSSRS